MTDPTGPRKDGEKLNRCTLPHRRAVTSSSRKKPFRIVAQHRASRPRGLDVGSRSQSCQNHLFSAQEHHPMAGMGHVSAYSTAPKVYGNVT